MRSGSTLLQHILNQHSKLQSFSDLSSLPVLFAMRFGFRFHNRVVKPLDLFFLGKKIRLLRRFEKRIWLTRDPRDAYVSSLESGYAYWFWPKGRVKGGVDLSLLRRWKRIQSHYLKNKEDWYLVRYEDLVTRPEETVRGMLEYLELPYEKLFPFKGFTPISGGDMKLAGQSNVHSTSVSRFRRKMSEEQIAVFDEMLSEELEAFAYEPGLNPEMEKKAAAN